MQKLVSKRDKQLVTDFTNNGNKRGTVVITYEEGQSASNQVLELSLSANKGDYTEGYSYFYIVSKRGGHIPIQYFPIMRSEIVKYSLLKGNQNMNKWAQSQIPINSLIDSNAHKDMNLNRGMNYVDYNTQV
jgi:hypothetical protein